MALRSCKDCGKEYSKSAKKCPHCGAINPTVKITQLVILLLMAVVGVIVYFSFKGISSSFSGSYYSTTPQSTTPQQPAYVLDTRSDSQKNFQSISYKYAVEYRKAENPIQKTRARDARRNEFRSTGIKTVTDWYGTIADFRTTGDGHAYVSIKLSDSNVELGNAVDDLSDSLFKRSYGSTLIQKNTALYGKLASMGKGKEVRFSGTLITGDDSDYYFAYLSLNESTAMSQPVFMMRFSDISLKGNTPITTDEINLRVDPSPEAERIILLKKGTRVRLLSNPETNGWIKVSVDGQEGYVNSKYLGY
jgi:hypothetical protein